MGAGFGQDLDEQDRAASASERGDFGCSSYRRTPVESPETRAARNAQEQREKARRDFETKAARVAVATVASVIAAGCAYGAKKLYARFTKK